jgi:hypothetical protein
MLRGGEARHIIGLAYFRNVAYLRLSWFLIASRSFDEKIV